MADHEYTDAGRWGGSLTRRALPTSDPLIEQLSAEERQRLTAIWLGRTAMERRVADAFVVVRDALTRRKAAPDLIALAHRAIDDEYRHTELSRVVASRISGREEPLPQRLELDVPRHRGASPELRDTLFITGQCVLNETTASAFLECCLTHAKGALIPSALRELLSDEIDHGRIGWAHLATLPQHTRDEVAQWLLPMAYLNLRIWREYTPLDARTSPALTALGSPPGRVIDAALVGALSDLIVPGLKDLGMNTAPIRAWLDAGAQSDVPPTEFLGQK